MQKHPHFDLWIHTDGELEEILGERIEERTTLHEWPLSCVQRIATGSGTRTIYKAQHSGSVEPEFYRRAQSPILPAARCLGSLDGTQTMLIEYIDAPRMKDMALDEAETLRHGRTILEKIAEIRGDLPVALDIATPAKWTEFAESTVEDLDSLIRDGKFVKTAPEVCSRLRKWAGEPRVLDTIERTSAFTHGDLNGGNVFLCGDAYRIIDWQGPRRAPRGVDLAIFLEDAGHDPTRHVERPIVEVHWFLKVGACVECKCRLFPRGKSYDGYVADFTARILGPSRA